MADDGRAEVLATFMAITGADDGEASGMLDACDWVLEQAVNLYLSVGEGGGGGNVQAAAQQGNGNTNRSSGPAGWQPPPFSASGGAGGGRDGGRGSVSENGGQGGHRSGGDAGGHAGEDRGHSAHGFGGRDGGNGFYDEEEVRAPIASRVERLYDPTGPTHYSPQAMAAMLSSRHTQNAGPPESIVDAFGDFKAEGGSAGGAGGTEDSNRLSGMFKAPSELLFKGSFEQAKQVAGKEGRWLLVNIQSADEFGSYQLNRDTWRHEAVQGMLTGTFVFYQVQEKAPEGKRLMSLFNLRELPAILIVEPVTGAKLYDRSGFVDAETLMEALVPFLDAGPNDAGAAAMALSMPMKRRAHHNTAVTKTRVPLTEDEEMAMAIAQSMGNAQHDSSAAHPELDDVNEEEIYEQIRLQEAAASAAAAAAALVKSSAPTTSAYASSRPTPATANTASSPTAAVDPLVQAVLLQQVQQAATSRLTPEPAADCGCRMSVRLLDGSRINRRFNQGDPVSMLYDWCISLSETLAAAGARFMLSEAVIGGRQVSDQMLTLEQAGVIGSLLAAKIIS